MICIQVNFCLHTVTCTFSWIRQPSNVTVLVGFDVFFPCEYLGLSALPLWRRNGKTFSAHNPPRHHSINGSGLIISDVSLSMNMSWYSCFLDLFSGLYHESNIGYVTVITEAGIIIIIILCFIIIST